MAKCTNCGKRGLFLKLHNGLCSNCLSASLNQHVESASKKESAESYDEMRSSEIEWFESSFDLNSVASIQNIQAEKDLRCPSTPGVTGQLYYLLRKKAYAYEEEGQIDLAIACMRKSNELAILDYGTNIQKSELFPLVQLLARNGQLEEANAEKESIDKYCFAQDQRRNKMLISNLYKGARILNTDLVIMSAHGATCTECAKYQGRVFSLSGNSTKFPHLPKQIYDTGIVHIGCSHFLSPYIDEVSDPQLDYTLSVHQLQNPAYGSSIAVFSNRPFEDDRTEECKQIATAHLEAKEQELSKQKSYEENMIQIEYQRGLDNKNFRWLQEHIPDKCPKSVTGFRRMKTQNTKNYQLLKALAAELGREI